MLPLLSITMLDTKGRSVDSAGPRGAVVEQVPVPAIVVSVPFGPTFRIRQPADSAMYKFPLGSSARADGPTSHASWAFRPSGAIWGAPPAMLSTTPAVVSWRMRKASLSVTTPWLSATKPASPPPSWDCAAGPSGVIVYGPVLPISRVMIPEVSILHSQPPGARDSYA